MPGTHSAISRHLFTLDGNVLTSGGAKNLAKGQFTIVQAAKAGANGAVVVSDFAGMPVDTVLEMRLGKHKAPISRTAYNNKPYSSELFTIKDVVSVKANFPKVFKQEFDDLIVGYDGINDDAAIELVDNNTTVLDVILSGDHVGFVTGNCKHVIKLHFGKEVGDTNQDVIDRAVARLKGTKLPMGVPVTELIDIKAVNSENAALAGTPYMFSTLTLNDLGDSNALALVQAQYPLYSVIRTARNGVASEYTILHPQASALAAYTQVVPSYIKDCEDCAAGYDLIAGGFIYSISIEDDGIDVTTTIDDVPGFVTGSVVFKGRVDGVGTYTVVTDDALTDAEIAAYVATAGIKTTATFTYIGEVRDVCYDDTVTSTAWVDGDVCYASVENYKIQLKDDDCDGSRLAELQAAYPNLTIEAGAPTGEASQTVTVSADVALVIVINGVTYTTADAGTTTQTAAAFVVEHAAAILAATGTVVTNPSTNVLLFTDQAEGFPTITSAAQTVGAIDYLTTATVGGCQRVYSTQVITDIVCDECDPIFLDQFSSEAPADFDFTPWEKIETASSETAKMGIRITGKPFIFYPTATSRDEVPFYETSTRIEIAGGYIEEVNHSFDPQYSDIFEVRRLSRAKDRDNLGGHMMQWEDASRAYFDGTMRHKNNEYAMTVLGEESVLVYDKQYVSYEITIHDSKYSQGVGRRSDMGTTYILHAPIGSHANLEAYVNKLAVKAGLPAVNALAV